jgi:polysaccharide biosynthesis protein PelF
MRVRMITEGNFPSVIGGVTRWCDLLLEGLSDVDWSVLALGTGPSPGRRIPSVPIDYCSPGSPSRRRCADRPTASTLGLVSDLADQLFADVADPQRLQQSLVAVSEHLDDHQGAPAIDVAAEAFVRRADGPDDPAFLETVRQLLHEVVTIALRLSPPVDLNLCACAGRAVVPALVDAARRGTPAVVVEHGIYVDEAFLATASPSIDDGSRRVLRRSASNLAAAAYWIADPVIGVSEANRRRSIALGASPEHTRVVPNGVDVRSAAAGHPALPGPSHGHGGVVGMVGRIDPLKGVDRFIEVAASVAASVPGTSFVHIGPEEPAHSAYASLCRQLVEDLGLSDRFTFLGAHPDPSVLLDGLDVVVVPSRSEGMPFALLEAMAAGRPIVASAVGGVPETLGSTGILVEPEHLDGLAEAVAFLLREPAAAAELGAAARSAAQSNFRLDQMLDSYRAVLAAVPRPAEAAA